MEAVECGDCGCAPELITTGGEYALRCDCATALVIDSARNPRHVPESWHQQEQ